MTVDSAGPRPLTRTNLRESARDALRELIITGQLGVGDPLRQDELASRLGISRTPLREALQGLQAEGLVSVDPHRGAVVAKPSAKQLLETYEIREALEVLGGRAAAVASTPEHAREVEAILIEMTAETDPERWTELNTSFHAKIYEITGKSQLIELVDMLRNRAQLYIRLLARDRERTSHADQQHAGMLLALQHNDPEAMEQLIRSHLQSTAAFVSPNLK